MKNLTFILVLSCLMAALSAAGTKDEPSSSIDDRGFNWQRYAGTTIIVSFPNHVTYQALMPLVPEFEELTGIQVEVDLVKYLNLHDKQVLEFNKTQGDYDLVSYVVTWKTEYAQGGKLLPLQPFFDDPKLAYPAYDFNDFATAYVENTGMVGGRKIYLGGPGATLYGVPLGAETSFLIYRRDLLERYQLGVPETYEELLESAKFISENVAGVAGLTARGASGANATHAYLINASPFGAQILDDNMQPAFTSPASIATLKWMQAAYQYGPPGITSYDQSAQFQAFLQGDVAFYLDASVFAGVAQNPEKSKVYDKIGYAPHPRQQTNLSETGGFGIGIPTNSRNPKAAFLFLQWATSKETELKIVANGGAPSRMSTITDPALQQQHPEFAVLAQQLPNANPDWRPLIPEWGEINNLFGIEVNRVLTGEKTAEQAMGDLLKPIGTILTRAGY